MHHTFTKAKSKPAQYEEFLGYDEKGNPVVLRRSTNHPGLSAEQVEMEKQFSNRPQTVERPLTRSGSMRFFCEAKDLTGPLRKSA